MKLFDSKDVQTEYFNKTDITYGSDHTAYEIEVTSLVTFCLQVYDVPSHLKFYGQCSIQSPANYNYINNISSESESPSTASVDGMVSILALIMIRSVLAYKQRQKQGII